MDGYFRDGDLIRRVHREYVVALSGPRALLMQAAHPVAFAGFFLSTGALDDPYPRLQRTAAAMNTVIFGSRAAADRVGARVRRVHGRFHGVLSEPVATYPAGTPWAADDPELLLWIIATLVESALLVYSRYVRPLSRAEREEYWRQYRQVGRLFGLPDTASPGSARELEDYVREMVRGGALQVSGPARELAVQIVLRPPVPPHARPLLELVNFITVGLLPPELRRQYGLRWDPVRALAHRSGAEYTRRVLMPLLPGRVRHNRRPLLTPA